MNQQPAINLTHHRAAAAVGVTTSRQAELLARDCSSSNEPSAPVGMDEPAARNAIVREYHAFVRRVVRFSCSYAVEGEVEDVTQQVLLELLVTPARLPQHSGLDAWIRRFTIRFTQRHLRKELERKRMRARWLVPDRFPWGTDATVVTPDPLELEEALAKLTDERRQAIVMHYGVGYTVKEVSHLTRASYGTVKDRLVAAKKQLRRSMSAELVERGLFHRNQPEDVGRDADESCATSAPQTEQTPPNGSVHTAAERTGETHFVEPRIETIVPRRQSLWRLRDTNHSDRCVSTPSRCQASNTDSSQAVGTSPTFA